MSVVAGEKNIIITKPFIYGSVAIYLGKKSKDEETHKWCAYVRGVNNENISNFIKSVEFTLHDTFKPNKILLTKWPFEIYKTGWGEFDIKIKIELVDETAKPIELIHPLKFYTQPNQSQPSKRPVVNENYDEIIFVNPKPEILEQLLKDDKIFQEPKKISEMIDDDGNRESTNNLLNITGNNNLKNNSMDIDEEEKSVSKMDQTLNLNNNLSGLSSGILIPNVGQYFGKIDDSLQVKELQEKNQFIVQEIDKLKKELNLKEEEIMKLNKEIRKIK
jgi:YEATS domain-containing protein 4